MIIDLVSGGPRMAAPVRTVAESLDHFRTVAFGIEIMVQTIVPGVVMHGHVDASAWFAIVPECYRAEVVEALERAFGPHRGKVMRDAEMRALIGDINREIWASIEPILPGDYGLDVPK